MAFKCDNTWCTKNTLEGCFIPEPRNKCPFLRLKQMKEIVEQAETVRNKQKEYFKTRSPAILTQSKEEERRLDAMLVRYHQPIDYIQERFL